MKSSLHFYHSSIIPSFQITITKRTDIHLTLIYSLPACKVSSPCLQSFHISYKNRLHQNFFHSYHPLYPSYTSCSWPNIKYSSSLPLFPSARYCYKQICLLEPRYYISQQAEPPFRFDIQSQMVSLPKHLLSVMMLFHKEERQ